MALSYKFLQEVPPKLEIQCNKGGLLNGQNPLSVTKVICQQSLALIHKTGCFFEYILWNTSH